MFRFDLWEKRKEEGEGERRDEGAILGGRKDGREGEGMEEKKFQDQG